VTLETLTMLVVVLTVAAAAPFIVDRLQHRIAVPSVVFEILLGILVGPAVLGLVSDTDVISALAELGLAFLMFLAGYEIQFSRIRGGPLRRSVWSWLISLGLGLAIALLYVDGVTAAVVVGLALTTTALGMVLPIVKDRGDSATPFGDRVLAVGTVGEFGPIVVIAFALSGQRPSHTIAVLAIFTVLAIGGGWLARKPRHPRLGRIVTATLGTSAQVAVRLSVLVVVAMVALAEWLGLDPVLGAFTAGILIHLALESSEPEEAEIVQSRLEGIAFGFLVPIFFVVTGVRLDVGALFADVWAAATVPVVLALFLVVRGGPTYLMHRGVLPRADGLALAAYASTALPLIVVITTVGLRAGVLDSAHAAALVTAGMLSVLIFPILAARFRDVAARSRGGTASPPH
jgi:Kef-type K+ transport system membrane component KefB